MEYRVETIQIKSFPIECRILDSMSEINTICVICELLNNCFASFVCYKQNLYPTLVVKYFFVSGFTTRVIGIIKSFENKSVLFQIMAWCRTGNTQATNGAKID